VLAAGGLILALGIVGVDLGAQHVGGTNPWPIVPGLVVAGAGLALLIIPLVNVRRRPDAGPAESDLPQAMSQAAAEPF
jgi:hypothetical protein